MTRDGNFLGTRSFLATDDIAEQELNQQQIPDMATHTPQTSQVLATHLKTTSNDNTQLNSIKINHDPLSTPIVTSTNIPNSERTPNIANSMQPITLFGTNKESSPSSSQELLLSNVTCEEKGDSSLDDSKQHSYQRQPK